LALWIVALATQAYPALVGHWWMGEGATWDGTQWIIPDEQADPADGTSIGLVEADRVAGTALLGQSPPHYGMNLHDGAYIPIGNPAKLDITGDLTVAAWVKPASLSGFGPIIGKGDYQYMLRRGDSSFHFFTYDGSWHQVNADIGAVLDQWYFVAGRVDSATSTVSVWVNDTGYGTGTGGITSDTAPVEIGRNSTVTDRLFNGVIDDVRIYDHALTDEELLELYYSRVIVTQPVVTPSASVFEGEAVTVTVAASGTAPTYQWYKNGGPLSGETNATLSIPSAALDDSGDYYVEVTNDAGTATSETVTLLVQAASAPVFTQQPQSCTRYVNGYCTFAATVQGTPPISFQWKKNGEPLAGETNASLSLASIEKSDQGTYVLEATNAFGTTPSAGAVLTVLEPPANSFAERILSHGPVAYWRLNEGVGATTAFDYVGGYDGTHTAGVVLGNPGPRPAKFPGFETTNLCAGYDSFEEAGTEIPASLMSNRSAFTMLGWIKMPSIPNGRFALFGQNDVAEFGFHGDVLGIWTPGGGFASFDPLAEITLDEWMLIAATGDGTNLSLYLNGDLMNSASGVTANYGESTYPFRIGFGVLDATGNYLTGEIDEVALFDYALTQTDINALFAVAGGAVAPTITVQPVSVEVYAGADIQLRAQATGTLPLGYQWRKDGADLSDGGNISGANTAQLWISDVTAADEADYDVVVSNIAGSQTSVTASLTLAAAPPAGSYEELMASLGPVAYWSLNEASGSTVAFDRAGGNNATHDVYVTVGAEGPRPPAVPGMESGNLCTGYDGALYAETRTTASLMSNRSAFTLAGWINPNVMPQVTSTGSNRVALFGQNDVAEFGFHGANTLGIWSPTGGYVALDVSSLIFPYEWSFLVATADGTRMVIYLNGEIVATGGSITSNYGSSGYPFRIGYGVLDATENWFDGYIDEVGMWDRALTPSEVVTLYNKGADLAEPPEILFDPESGARFEGRDVTFNVIEAGSLPITYQWRKDGAALTDGGNISGATSQQLVIAGVTAGDMGDYDVVVSNAHGSVTSAAAELTVTAPAPGSYPEAVVSLDPTGYWPLDEDTGAVVASEVWNGRHGTYAAAAQAGQPGVPLPGFDPNNKAVLTTAGLANAQVDLPGLGFNTNTATILCWFDADGTQGGFRGLVFLRSGGVVSGLHFGNGMELRYSWADASNIATLGADIVVTWPMGTLESAPEPGGPYSPVGGATSPWVVTPTQDREFFRATLP